MKYMITLLLLQVLQAVPPAIEAVAEPHAATYPAVDTIFLLTSLMTAVAGLLLTSL